MKPLLSALAVLAGSLLTASLSFAASPAVAYTEAGKFDSSFNEAVFRNGVSRYTAQISKDLVEVEPESPAEFTATLTNLARQGRSPIVAVGFSYAAAVAEVAQAYPDTQFVILDTVVDLPNVQSIVFKEHEGSFLVGALAALKAEGDVVGFVGGMDLPFIRRFACGYAQGARYVNRDIQVLVAMIGNDPSAWGNPTRAAELADEMIARNAEVIYAAAGGSGSGVYSTAAKNPNVYAIGVDSNQNFLEIGTMLTSMVKNVGSAALASWIEAENGTWQPGVKALGVADGGVDWALDIFNRSLVSLDHEKEVNKIRDRIVSGRIEVVDFLDNNSCPVTLTELN